MSPKARKPPALVTRNGSEMSCLAADNSDHNLTLSEFQTHRLIAAHGLTYVRAKLIASLCFGEVRT